MEIEKIFQCIGYLAIIGVFSFFGGRILPPKWFSSVLFPYKSFSFEKEGQIYKRLHIQYWQKKVPDMSKVFPKLMPPKNLARGYEERLSRMIQETCVAEFIHFLLSVLGLLCSRILPGTGGILIAGINIIVNAVFIIIQRYNRPRLLKLQKSICNKEEKRVGAGPK